MHRNCKLFLCMIRSSSTCNSFLFVEHRSQKSNGRVSNESLFERLRYLGRLLDYEVDGHDEFMWLQDQLNRYDVDEAVQKETVYNSYGNMKRLSPQCEELILSCVWDKVTRNCSELFQLRATQEGFCCIFNYLRKDNRNYNDEDTPIRTKHFGPDYGLRIILNASTADYYYPLSNSEGFSAIIFQSFDYPDPTSGYLNQRFIKPNVETWMELFPSTLVGQDSVRVYSPIQRNCLFRDEVPEYGDHYSQSDCLFNCRIESYVALCGCIPFFIIHSSYNPVFKDQPSCTLEHVQCLNKYKS